MRSISIIIFFTIIIGSCVNVKSKKDHKDTTEVCDKLYVEVYTVFGSGAYGGDLLTDYLTDSANFRIFIGKYDDYKEIYNYECNGKKILITKVTRNSNDTTRYLEKKIYVLDSLRAAHRME